MKGKRVVVFGLGRSGLAVAQAAKTLGATAIVVDEKPKDSLSKPELAEELGDIEAILGWTGAFHDLSPDFVVANPAVTKTHPKLLEARSQGVEVISEVEFAYRISKAPIVAITGTNGKSTTTVMTYLCLKACGEDPILCGNIFGSGYEERPMTEAALDATADQILVAEISSFQLEWVVDFKPVAAGITNIWPDHLDRYTGFPEYAATKMRIFAKQDEDDFAVVKANDPVAVPPGGGGGAYQPRGRRAPQQVQSKGLPTVLTFGATGEHGRVEELDLVILEQRIRLDQLPFDEPHNYVNAAMAGLLAYGALKSKAKAQPNSNAAKLIAKSASDAKYKRKEGRSVYAGRQEEPGMVAPPEIIEGLKNFHGLAHRMERLGEKGGIRVINNSMCTNPDAVIKSAQSLKDPAHLLIGGVNKGLDFKPLRNYLANQRHKAYLFGSDAAKLNEMLGGNHPLFDTLKEAFDAAAQKAKKGEVIMLAPGCASTDQFRDFRDRGNVFKQIAKEWLE